MREQIICPGCGAVLDIYKPEDIKDGLYSFYELTGHIMPVIESTAMVGVVEYRDNNPAE